MRKLIQKCPSFLLILVILAIEIILFKTNYLPGTWLIGWDNLLPELNFSTNIKRGFLAVWQEYRGLGLLDGMAHAANLAHSLFLFLLSFFFPKSLLRYAFTFLMHLLGGVGIFVLLDQELLKKKRFKKSASLLGALFYLFNLATIQMFYTPLEVFTTHFAALPWLTLFLIKYLNRGSRKDLLWFFFSSILFTPQSFVPSIFIVYLISVLTILFFSVFQKRQSGFKKSVIVLVLIFLVNSFWGLPFIYSGFKNAGIIAQSKINQMGTDDLFRRNQAYGNFLNTSLLRGFSLDLTDHNRGEIEYLMKPWREHINKPLAKIISVLFLAMTIFGLVIVIVRKERKLYPFLFFFLFCFLMLGNNIPILSYFYQFSQKFIPFFHQVFRITFTKFAIAFAFGYAIFLALGLEFLFLAFSKLWKKLPILMLITCVSIIYIYTSPSFQGNFFYHNLRLKLPQEYLDLIEFFKKENKNTRIATLPQPSFWGWTAYRWGFRGSGFLWYGVEQPTMDRAFDPWSQENEGYYWELSHALFSRDLALFEKVLQKYQINWILLDESVFSPDNKGALQIDALNKMLKNSSIVSQRASFGKLKVFKVFLPIEEKDFVFLANQSVWVEPSYQWADKDQAFAEQGIYYSHPQLETVDSLPSFYYPFRELFTKNNAQDKNWQIQLKDQSISFKTNILADQDLSGEPLNISSSKENKETVVIYRQDFEEYELWPQISINNHELEVLVEKYNLVRPEEIDFNQKIGKKETCSFLKEGNYDLEIIEEGKKFLRLSAQNTSSCTAFNYPYLYHRYGYLLVIESRNVRGKEALFYITNETTKNRELEIFLPKSKDWISSYNILPPQNPYGRGYSLHFDSASIGSEKAVNDLADIKIYPIPYNYLKGLKISKGEQSIDNFSFISPSPSLTIKKINPSFYKIEVGKGGEEKRKQLLVLSQSFNTGWTAATFLNNKPKILNHLLINNWANGWEIEKLKVKSEKLKVYIFFWPQILQYLGFLLLAGTAIWLVFWKTPQRSQISAEEF